MSESLVAPSAESREESVSPEGARARRLAEVAASKPPPIRQDLEFRRQEFAGENYFVLKDPLRLKYFRLHPEEAQLAMWLTGDITIEQLSHKFSERYPNHDFGILDIASFVEGISKAGLLNEAPEGTIQRMDQMNKMRSSMMGRWAKTSSTLLFLKIPLFTPGPWLGKLVHAIRFVWRPWFLILMGSLMVFTIMRLIVHSSAFGQQWDGFFTPANIFLLWVSIILTKTCHELGHATTTRYFGGQVPEVGICFICLTPCGYVDASDAWMMPKRSQKIAIALSGIVTEFFIATIAANIWLETSPGLLNSLMFNIMLIASINTLIMNLNPLMKFDGYYVLADSLEIPNLRTKALAYCGGWLKHYFFNSPKPNVSREHGRVFIMYAIVAFVYMIVISIGLSIIFLRFLDPIGLKTAGIGLGLFIFVSLIGLPVIKAFIDVNQLSKIKTGFRPWKRAGVMVPLLLIILGGLYFFPVHYDVRVQGVVVPRERDDVTASVDGWVETLYVQENDDVQVGQPLLKLENPELVAQYESARIELDSAILERNWSLDVSRAPQNIRASTIASEKMEILLTRVQRLARQVENLTVRASQDGRVRSLPTAQMQYMVGRAYLKGEPMLLIEDTSELNVLAALSEEDIVRLEVSSEVELQGKANLETFSGKVTQLPVRPARWEEIDPSMFVSNGGVLPADPITAQPSILDSFPVFLIRVEFDDQRDDLIPGMRVRLEIKGKPVALGKRTIENFKRYLTEKSGGVL